MDIHLIAVHYCDVSKKNIVAFRLLDADSGQVMDQPYESVYNVVNSNKAVIHGISLDKNEYKLKGSNGAFDRYPAICNGKQLNNPLVIIYSIDNGFTVCNFEGKRSNASYDEVISFANKIGIANGKIVTKDNKQFISAISGEYIDKSSIKPAIKKDKKEEIRKTSNIRSKLADKEYVKNIKRADLRVPKVITGIPATNSKLKEFDEVSQMTVEQKLSNVMLILKFVRPFYYSIYNSLRRVEANEQDGISTMAVSLDTLYFNSDFVKEMSISDLLFVCIHEVSHIAMRHRARERGREHDIWNQACDFYINRCIAVEFGLNNPGDKVEIETKISTGKQYMISLPYNCLYNDKVNIDMDTPELIYEELKKQLNENDKDDNSQGDESSDNNQENSENNSGSGQSDSSKKDSKSESSNGNDNSDEKDSENNNSSDNSSNNKGKQSRLSGKQFRGQEIPDLEQDIVDDANSRGMSSDQIEQKAASVLNRAVTIHKQSHSFGGPQASFLERVVERALAPKVDWKKLLKNKLTLASQKVNTFSAPDKRFRSRNMIVPGPKALNNDALEAIKICCDTSGSITDKDLGIVFAQIEQLLKNFKADAEMLYWDTDVRAVYPFKDIKDLVSKKPMGGGGTDANCIFKYFEEERDYKIGKKKKPSVILIFTDGYFSVVHDKYKKYKDVIWIIKDNKNFKPPFGVVAPFKQDEN